MTAKIYQGKKGAHRKRNDKNSADEHQACRENMTRKYRVREKFYTGHDINTLCTRYYILDYRSNFGCSVYIFAGWTFKNKN